MLPATSPLAGWGTFYQIVGSSAGALTGLQFVVVALSAQSRTLRKTEGSLHASARRPSSISARCSLRPQS